MQRENHTDPDSKMEALTILHNYENEFLSFKYYPSAFKGEA
jgi:hypothetical protein